VDVLVYLDNTARETGLTKKLQKFCTRPYKVTTKIQTNHEIMDQFITKHVVHVNRLKPNYNPQTWKRKLKQKVQRTPPRKFTQCQKEEEEEEEEDDDEIKIGQLPLRIEPLHLDRDLLDQTFDTPQPDLHDLDTPIPQRPSANYEPPETPRTRRELEPIKVELPLRRSGARIFSQELVT
jgi:hypothetical protein